MIVWNMIWNWPHIRWDDVKHNMITWNCPGAETDDGEYLELADVRGGDWDDAVDLNVSLGDDLIRVDINDDDLVDDLNLVRHTGGDLEHYLKLLAPMYGW